CQQYESLPFSF
nr:immunoglobulin light chain junction region [Macaca mulatta]